MASHVAAEQKGKAHTVTVSALLGTLHLTLTVTATALSGALPLTHTETVAALIGHRHSLAHGRRAEGQGT